MAGLAQQILDVWRDAERAVGVLPALDPDQVALTDVIEELRAAYQSVTQADEPSVETVSASDEILRGTADLLDRVSRRIDGGTSSETVVRPDTEPVG